MAKIKEKTAARGLDPLLSRGQIVHLEAEMMGADEALCIVEPGAAFAESAKLMTPSLR